MITFPQAITKFMLSVTLRIFLCIYYHARLQFLVAGHIKPQIFQNDVPVLIVAKLLGSLDKYLRYWQWMNVMYLSLVHCFFFIIKIVSVVYYHTQKTKNIWNIIKMLTVLWHVRYISTKKQGKTRKLQVIYCSI